MLCIFRRELIERPIAYVDPSFCLLVARDLEACWQLQNAFRRAELRVETTRELIAPNQVPARVTAIVWLADDHPPVAVVATVRRLREQRPGLRLVLVTAWPDEFTALLVQATGRVAPVILRRPAVGADVLRAIGSDALMDASY